MNFHHLKEKIKSLGGVEKREKGGLNKMGGMPSEIIAKLPQSYVLFCKEYGAFDFNNDIVVKCIDKNPVADTNGSVSIDRFYDCVHDGGQVSELMYEYREQLPDNCLPIFDGEPGDLICLSLVKSTFGAIYYWHHESNPGMDIYLVAVHFADLILKLEVVNESEDKEDLNRIKKVTLSPKFLDMLKKDGYGPKNEKE